MNPIIQNQLKQVKIADLTNFDSETNTYIIPKINGIKIIENYSYLIKLKDEFFDNIEMILKWNNNLLPRSNYLKADILQLANNLVKVMAIEYNPRDHVDIGYWNGWLPISEFEVLQQL